MHQAASLSDPPARLGAFCAHASPRLEGAPRGPLSGRTFAVKDVFAIAGVAACFGNPTWLHTHASAARTAATVTALVEAGATLVGLTITDELALSLTGENHHYGTPINPCCPDRVPGGSSSGSAVAVAGGFADFALGTDTGGSVRVPASHTGLFGMRPTWGAVPEDGLLPLAPRFDTVGWFARDAETLAAVGAVVLAASSAAATRNPERLVIPRDVEALLDPEARESFFAASSSLADALELPLERETLGEGFPDPVVWAGTYLALQNAELATVHRTFIERERPTFGSLIGGRVASALRVTPAEVSAAEAQRGRAVAAIEKLLERAWLVLPSAPGAAPRRGSSDAAIDAFTFRGLTLASLASLAGLPQVSLPLASSEGCPLGVSLVGARGEDPALLRTAARASSTPRPPAGPTA